MTTQRMTLVLLCLLLGLGTSSLVWAEPLDKIDPALRTPVLPTIPQAMKRDNTLSVSVRLSSLPTGKQQLALQKAGFLPMTLKGQALGLGTLVFGRVSQDKLNAVASLPFVERIDAGFRKVLRPMDTAREATGIDQAYDYTDDNDLPVNGEGVTLCIDDSRVDLFHPAYFKDDGGTFDWLDVNENGSFDPGVDAVDLNDNGQADEGETLSFFDALINRDGGGLDNDDGVYQVDMDYLYNDRNSDSVRNYGSAEGFTEADPTYGEQLFYAVDQNGNNSLDVGESLVGLATSKVPRAYVLNMSTGAIDEYVRGENLIDYPFEETSYVSHGTGTSGISASGWPVHKYRGVAWGAEIVLVDSYIGYVYDRDYDDNLNVGATLALCRQAGADLALHEWCTIGPHALDGTSNDEEAMDQAEAEGMIQINPTCNYHGSRKAARFRVAPQSTQDFQIIVDPLYPMDGYRYVSMDLRWRAPDQDVTVYTVKNSFETQWEEGYEQDNGIWTILSKLETERGTVSWNYMLYSESGPDIAVPLTFRVKNNSPLPLDLHGFVTDDVSRFYYGLVFDRNGTDNTLASRNVTSTTLPATTDSGIGIGAFEHRYGVEGLAEYSGRGLRIDGKPTVQITGTYAQYTPGASYTPEQTHYDSYDPGNYILFGGTSSSSPLLAGITALLLQYAPEVDAAGVRKMMRLGADKSMQSGDVDADWGFGRAWVPGFLDARDRAMNDESDPQPSIYSEAAGVPGERMAFSAAGSQDDRGISTYHWAVEPANDSLGPFDRMWLLYTFDQPGDYTVSLTVTDEGGNTASTSKTVHILEEDEAYSVAEEGACYGGCNLWQPSVCENGQTLCHCVEGSWQAQSCEAFCAESGVVAEGCVEGEDGQPVCRCTDDPIPSDDDDDDTTDDDDDDSTADDDDDDNVDDDDDDDSSEGSGSDDGGCRQAGQGFTWSLLLLALVMGLRRRYGMVQG